MKQNLEENQIESVRRRKQQDIIIVIHQVIHEQTLDRLRQEIQCWEHCPVIKIRCRADPRLNKLSGMQS